MRIKKIYIAGFGKLKDFELDLQDGINVITGPNEAGKSTLHLFIRSMLYGADKRRHGSEKAIYDRMRPWKNPEIYGGSIEVSSEDGLYRIERNFAEAADDIRIYDAENGRYIPGGDTAELMSKLLNGLSETAYVNTVSSGQLKAATGRDMASEIRKYAANITGTVNPGLSADDAIAYLSEIKKEKEEMLDKEAQTEYNRLLVKIKKTEEELKSPELINKTAELKKAGADCGRLAEETAVILGDNELKIKSYGSRLAANGLDGTKSIEELSERTEALYSEYVDTGKNIPVYIVTGAICILTAGFGIMCRLKDIGGIFTAFDDYAFIFIIVPAALIMLAAVVIFKTAELFRLKKADGEEFSEILKKHTGSGALPGKESVESFRKELEEYKKEAEKLEEAKETRNCLVEKLNEINAEQRQKSEELDRQKKINELVDSDIVMLNELRTRAGALKLKIKENNRLRDEIEAAELAEDTLSNLAAGIRDAAGTYINAEASKMIEGFTGGRYNSINAGTNMDVELNCADGMVSVGDLSQGTADQVYMALRLSAIRFIAGREDPIPLILDDSFSLYDDDRLLGSMKFLAANYKGQMLIFTCQKREEDILTASGIRHNTLSITA